MINIKQCNSTHIIGFGGYLPYWRLGVEQVGANWGIDGERIKNGLGVMQKTVASEDEDSVTMAIEASLTALERAGVDPQEIGAVFVGSESHPYAVKPTGTIVADILGIGPDYFCADLQFACKAGTAGIQIVASMVEAGLIDYGLVIAVDKAQSKPGDALEYTAAAGAAAFIIGKNKEKSVAQLQHTYSYSSDTPDFWRRPRQKFPSHGGRFTGEPGYFAHVQQCLQNFLEHTNKTPGDFDHAIFHMPNSKFPLRVAKKFGFTQAQLAPGLLVPQIGNPYAASSPLGLVSTLESLSTTPFVPPTETAKHTPHARKKTLMQEKNSPKSNAPTESKKDATCEKDILVVSYGSGAGSDAFWFTTKQKLQTIQDTNNTIASQLQNYQTIDYLAYLKKWETL